MQPPGGGVPWGHSGSLRGGHPFPGDAGVCGQRRPQGAPEWGWAQGHTQARVRCPRAGIGGSLGQCRGALRGPQEGTHTSTPPGVFHEPPVLTPTLGGSCHHCSILRMQKPRCGEEQRLAQGYLVTKRRNQGSNPESGFQSLGSLPSSQNMQIGPGILPPLPQQTPTLPATSPSQISQPSGQSPGRLSL